MSMEVPAGFDLYRTPAHKLLLLPTQVFDAVMNDRRRQEAAQDEEQRIAEQERRSQAVVAARVSESGEEEAAFRVGVVALARPAPAGFYRVLPRFAEMLAPKDAEDQKLGSPDSDVRARKVALVRRLAKLGPDRCVATPSSWRIHTEALERDLPNFREPIRIIANTLALAETSGKPLRIPPLLLLGPPGVGKTYFSQRVADMLGAPHASVAFDQPMAGDTLRGSDKHWGNTESGLLFKLLCLGQFANPLILLDELDKSASGTYSNAIDPLAQLHGALEPQTARCMQDASTEFEFDASLVGYVATANSIHGIGVPLLSRFEIFQIPPPDRDESVRIAKQISRDLLRKLELHGHVTFDRKTFYVMGQMSPRLMRRTAERLVAAAVREERDRITEADIWAEVDSDGHSRTH